MLTEQKKEAMVVEISRLQPAPTPEVNPELLREKPLAAGEIVVRKTTKESIEALVEGFERGCSPYSTLLQTFLLIPCQALQDLKKVNPELDLKMAQAVLSMIRTGDQTEILAVFDNDKNLVQTLAKLNPNVNQAVEYMG